jgi:hypothetical protein
MQLTVYILAIGLFDSCRNRARALREKSWTDTPTRKQVDYYKVLSLKVQLDPVVGPSSIGARRAAVVSKANLALLPRPRCIGKWTLCGEK